MKSFALFTMLLFAAGLSAQEVIPPGTILPVQLNSALHSDKLRPGQQISARVMQDVPLGGHAKIRAGSKVIGRVIEAKPASGTSPAEVALRFDRLAVGKRTIPVTTSLRALATMMDVAEAQVPETGPDRGTPEYYWTTEQIGGEVVYHGGGAVVHGSYAVGKSVGDGVLVRVSANPRGKCSADSDSENRLQALWVFSSDACGLYDFPNLKIVHAGRTEPVGEIRLQPIKGNVSIPSGSGLLLRVRQAQ